MDQLIDILKSKAIQMPRLLLYNYKKLNINEQELVVLIYLMNMDGKTYNPKQISKDLDLKKEAVLEIINTLAEKGLISIEIAKINNVRSDVINLDLLFEKLALKVMNPNTNETKDNDIYEIFEKEVGRGLTPMEFEIINGWLDIEYSKELIICALREAIYNGTTSFRYIDRILFEWNKKGIKTKEDVEKNKREFKKTKNNNVELFDCDWLNDIPNS